MLTVVVSFAVFIRKHRWGATDKVALSLPGDELAPQPLINWTNAIDIDALRSRSGRGSRS
jgi:hypothetical protein